MGCLCRATCTVHLTLAISDKEIIECNKAKEYPGAYSNIYTVVEHNRLRFDAVEKEVYLNKTEKAFSLLRLRKDFL
jgi:hypothetical protein